MSPLCFPLMVLCLFHWTVTFATDCGKQQFEGNGQCCNMCPPGKYVKDFCTKDKPTVCTDCEQGHFYNDYNAFGRCHKCQVCQQNYTQKCTPTTNAECSCQHGFLCSDSLCTRCEKNKCRPGEKLKQRKTEDGSFEYSCEPGPPETVPENRPHCSPEDLCSRPDWVHGFLGIGFTVLSVILLLLLAYLCVRKLRRRNSRNTTVDNPAITAKTADFQLSQEESGLAIILQDVSNVNDYLIEVNLEKV